MVVNELLDGLYGSRLSLTREDYQLHAADFKPGSHLEVGEPKKRRICPFDGIGSGEMSLTLPSKPRERRASVDHDTVGVLYPSQVDGMSEYPSPTYPEPDWEVTYARTTI